MVLGIVFAALAMLIRYGYEEHDKVTGAMILQEIVQIARMDQEGLQEDAYYESIGEQIGNPRLWLGEYEVNIEREEGRIKGEAFAGEWKQEMEMDQFHPGGFLRQAEILRELIVDREENDD